jgi:hypothetical protein
MTPIRRFVHLGWWWIVVVQDDDFVGARPAFEPKFWTGVQPDVPSPIWIPRAELGNDGLGYQSRTPYGPTPKRSEEQ